MNRFDLAPPRPFGESNYMEVDPDGDYYLASDVQQLLRDVLDAISRDEFGRVKEIVRASGVL